MIVENEYEDVGRKVLDGHDLQVDMEEKRAEKPARKSETKVSAPRVDQSPVCPIPPASSSVISNLKSNGVMASSPPISELVVNTNAPSHATSFVAATDVIVAENALAEATVQQEPWLDERREWITDDNHLEEILGICYRSFVCGSVALFVPTPFGDYIAFHEGCPHHYLSMESVEAFKRDGR